MMKRELTLFPEPATTIAELRQWMQMLGTIYRRMMFVSFMTVCMREYTPALPPEGSTLCIDVTMDVRCLGQSIAGWCSSPLWPFACENTRLHCRQRAVHCVLMRLWMQDAWDNLSQDDVRLLYDRLHAIIHACIAARGQYIVYWCDYLGTSYCNMCHINFQFNELILESVAFFLVV